MKTERCEDCPIKDHPRDPAAQERCYRCQLERLFNSRMETPISDLLHHLDDNPAVGGRRYTKIEFDDMPSEYHTYPPPKTVRWNAGWDKSSDDGEDYTSFTTFRKTPPPSNYQFIPLSWWNLAHEPNPWFWKPEKKDIEILDKDGNIILGYNYGEGDHFIKRPEREDDESDD